MDISGKSKSKKRGECSAARDPDKRAANSKIMPTITQEQAAVLNAISQVCEITGFGRVMVEIRDGKVRLIEISATVLIKRNDGKIEEERRE